MTGQLDGKVAVITGAAAGIGRATARLFAHEGARLALCDVNGDGMQALAAELEADGADVLASRVDIGDEAQIVAFVASEQSRWATGQNFNADGGSVTLV